MKIMRFSIYCTLAVAGLLISIGCDRSPTKHASQDNVEKLIGALVEGDRETRIAAIQALGDLKAETAVNALGALIRNPDQEVVLAAIEALVAIGGNPAEKYLITATNLDDRKACISAINGLGTHKSSLAIQPLIIAMDSPDTGVATAAAVALGLINDTRATKALFEKTRAPSRSLRLACVKSLASLGPEAIKSLTNVLGDEDQDIRQAAITALVEAGEPARPCTLAALRNKKSSIRRGAVTVLEESHAVPTEGSNLIWYQLAQIPPEKNVLIGSETVDRLARQGSDAAEALIEAVAHDAPSLREHAFFALETIGEPCILQAINAVEAHASPAGKEWFNQRNTWPGAPSWRIDLWSAATALNPHFKLVNHNATGIQPKAISLRAIASSDFQVSREYIPLLIEQICMEAGSGTRPPLDSRVNIKPENEKLENAINHLVYAGEMAVFPLIAGVFASDRDVAGVCANILGDIGDPRAVAPLAEVLSRRIKKEEELTQSLFYIALQKLNDPSTKALLRKVRPNETQANRSFEQQYPNIAITYTRAKNTTAGNDQPIGFLIGYVQNEETGELRMVYKKTREGKWIPSPPLPAKLP